ncbi:MAG: 16S rRNA (guanine(966)-N(2))-methyltransferase RsmD [Nitrospirota bacterium]
MRITGGTGKGRQLNVPKGLRVRPTSDKVKQALFNILGERILKADFLDLYAGAGGIGLEALSRGADSVTFVDASHSSLQAIQQNIEQLGFGDQVHVVSSKAESFLKKSAGTYDIVFLDPPYTDEITPLLVLIEQGTLMKSDAVVIAEHFKKKQTPEFVGHLMRYRQAVYGDTVLTFYKFDP